jgi:hypothetical protein
MNNRDKHRRQGESITDHNARLRTYGIKAGYPIKSGPTKEAIERTGNSMGIDFNKR